MTTAEIIPSFLDEIDQLPEVIPGAGNLEPGRLSWYHGVDAGKIKTPGVFFARETAFVELPPAEQWEVDDRYADKGEAGFAALKLRLAFIHNRSQWFIPGERDNDPPTWIEGYQDGAKKLTEYLVLIDGIADPMVLSVSGKYKATPIADILSAYRRGALAQAMRKIRRTLPVWSFWLTIGGKIDANGKPVYEEAKDGQGVAQGSKVTPPTLLAAPQPVTRETLLYGAEVWEQYQEWSRYRRTERAEAAYLPAPSQAPQLTSGKNVPELIEEGDTF